MCLGGEEGKGVFGEGRGARAGRTRDQKVEDLVRKHEVNEGSCRAVRCSGRLRRVCGDAFRPSTHGPVTYCTHSTHLADPSFPQTGVPNICMIT